MTTKNQNKITKRPADAFMRCPDRLCGNTKLRTSDIDVFCDLCGWNSLKAYVDAGGLDWFTTSSEQPVFDLALNL